MSREMHRYHASKKPDDDDDDERSEGELDSSSSSDTDDEPTLPKSTPQLPQTSQSWTTMLTEHNLSSIMSNALADNSEIIHIDDPIAQQSANPLTYVFPPGTNVDEYFERKQKQTESKSKPKHKSTRRDLKNLSHLLNHEKNEDLLRVILNTLGCQRAFQYAHEAIRSYRSNDVSLKTSDDGQIRTLGGVYFKMFINDNENQYLTENEREIIKKRNQEIQKEKKKKRKKKNIQKIQ